MTDRLCPDDPSRPIRMPMRVAAVCYRRTSRAVEFLLVRTRFGQAWTFPKGRVESGESPVHAAAREAKEEAGAAGPIAATPFTRYRYPALVGPGSPPGEVCVEAYLMKVTSLSRDGPVEHRRTSWFTPEMAVRRLAEGRHPGYAREHARVIAAAAASIQGEAQPEQERKTPPKGIEP